MKRKKDINKESEKMASIYESGGGFGNPNAKEEHDRKIQLLMHKQNLEISKRNFIISIILAIVAILNIGVLIYQVFWR